MTPERLEEIRNADRNASWGGIVAELLAYVDQIRAVYALKDELLTQAAAITDAERDLAEQCATEQALRLCREIETLRAEVRRLSTRASTGPVIGPIPDDAKTTDYCTVCGESPDSGSHIFGHTYQRPVTGE